MKSIESIHDHNMPNQDNIMVCSEMADILSKVSTNMVRGDQEGMLISAK